MMKIIKDGLYVHAGAAGGPLVEAALRRAHEAGRRLDRPHRLTPSYATRCTAPCTTSCSTNRAWTR